MTRLLFAISAWVLATGLAMTVTHGARAAETPPIPWKVPVLVPGDARLDASRLAPYEAKFAMGRDAKDGPLATGEKIQARAYQTMSLERKTVDGRDVLVRSFALARADNGQEVANGEIHLDAHTLQPIRSRIEQGGQTTEYEYDWESYVVRRTPAPEEGQGEAEESVDLPVLEAAAHETWMGALPLRKGFTARIPAIFAGGGGKWWAVPRVVGSEKVDIGDGKTYDTWVVELDWWGMGKSHKEFTAGGGANGSAGPGGKYWVLKKPLAGVPPVVRVRTEINEEADSVIQLQDGMGE